MGFIEYLTLTILLIIAMYVYLLKIIKKSKYTKKRLDKARLQQWSKGVVLSENCHRKKWYSYHKLLGSYSEPIKFYMWLYTMKLIKLTLWISFYIIIFTILLTLDGTININLKDINENIIFFIVILLSSMFLFFKLYKKSKDKKWD